MSDVGDGSFQRFVAERSTRLLRTAYLLTGDRRQAEDLLQTTLVAAHRHWGRIDPADPTPFVRGVLVRTAAGWRRRVRVSELVSATPLLSSVSGLPGFAVPASDPGVRDEMTSALAELPPRMRAVLVLRYWEDLSEAGTAEALGCPVDSVRSQTSRGLARLRELLDTTGTARRPAPEAGADPDVETRLRHGLADRASVIPAAPVGLFDAVLDGHRTQRRHRAALAALAAVLLGIAVLAALTVGTVG